MFREQFTEFAVGSRQLQNETSENWGSPYGDNWDLLWVGQ
jgi:hypothetical protein